MTNQTIPTAGYIVHDGETVWGLGDTSDGAWADFLDYMRAANVRVIDEPTEDDLDNPREWTSKRDYTISPASAELLQAVRDQGGNITWSMAHDVACTGAEAAHEEA